MFSVLMNHPVHFNMDGQMSPSAFIPFCDFGGNMEKMGVKINQFDVPVCNSFQAKILNDQLCYEVDLEKFRNNTNIEHELKLGFVFVMDYNEDRQFTFLKAFKKDVDTRLSVKLFKEDDNEHASIYLNTIGKYVDF